MPGAAACRRAEAGDPPLGPQQRCNVTTVLRGAPLAPLTKICRLWNPGAEFAQLIEICTPPGMEQRFAAAGAAAVAAGLDLCRRREFARPAAHADRAACSSTEPHPAAGSERRLLAPPMDAGLSRNAPTHRRAAATPASTGALPALRGDVPLVSPLDAVPIRRSGRPCGGTHRAHNARHRCMPWKSPPAGWGW